MGGGLAKIESFNMATAILNERAYGAQIQPILQSLLPVVLIEMVAGYSYERFLADAIVNPVKLGLPRATDLAVTQIQFSQVFFSVWVMRRELQPERQPLDSGKTRGNKTKSTASDAVKAPRYQYVCVLLRPERMRRYQPFLPQLSEDDSSSFRVEEGQLFPHRSQTWGCIRSGAEVTGITRDGKYTLFTPIGNVKFDKQTSIHELSLSLKTQGMPGPLDRKINSEGVLLARTDVFDTIILRLNLVWIWY